MYEWTERELCDVPNEKKSTAGEDEAVGRDNGAECLSSTETLALPRATEVGMNGNGGFFSTSSSKMAECAASSVSVGTSASWSSSTSSTVVVLASRLGAV